MMRQLTKIRNCCFGTKYSRHNSEPNHLPTTYLWATGNGVIPKKNILVGGWNVNGYRSVVRKELFRPFLSQLKPDFLCLNETKLDIDAYFREIQGKIQHEGYHEYWNFCKISSGYSGVMILTPHKPISIVEDIPSKQSHSLQGRMLTLQYESFYLVNVYKPNSGNALARLSYRVEQYDVAFNVYVKHLKQKKHVIIFGDMNVSNEPIDLSNHERHRRHAGFTNPQRQVFKQTLNLGYTDSFRFMHPNLVKYTYWSYLRQTKENIIGWRLDYILSSDGLRVLEANIHDDVRGSDHCPVSALIQIN